jgi:heptosyltransferase-3
VCCAPPSAYVGNDSGISHLAAALGRPALVLFGPSNPDLWSPRGARVLRAPDGDLSRLSVYDVVGALPA